MADKFWLQDKPAGETESIRAGVAGPMGATDEELDREAADTRTSIAQAGNPQDREMLEEHLRDVQRNRARPQPAAAPQTQWWNADKPAAQRDLPAGVTPSNAGGGRGSVNPPADGPPAPEPEFVQGDPMGSGVDGMQQAAASAPAGAPPPSTGSVAKDVAINLGGGLARTATSAGAAAAEAVGAHDTATKLDEISRNWQGVMQESGGETIPGKVADLTGSVAPAMLLPATKIAQVVGNAGLFAIPAFRDTLKSQLDAGRSFPLALAHASEAFGINLFMPTIATKGSTAITKALGAEGAQGVKAGATQLAQAAGEGAAFSAGSSAIDKGTDVIAGQENDRDWVDLKDMAASALGFSALRGAHVAPQVASAINDRVGSPSRQFGRALGQDVADHPFGTVHDDASADSMAEETGLNLNPNLATAKAPATPAPVNATTLPQATDDSPAAAVSDITAQLQAIRPLQDRAQKLRDAGEDVVADELDRRANTQAADIELQAHPDAGPAFESYYRTLRADGAKPAEASARAGMLGAFEQTASQAGISPKAMQAAIEKATGLPLSKVPKFLDRYVSELTAAGIGEPQDIGHVATTVGEAGEAAMHRSINTLYGEGGARPQAIDTGNDIHVADEPHPVQGWHNFAPETGSLGVPREEMPQIKAEHRGALVNFLAARGIGHEALEVDPATLKPTQAEFSPAKIKQAENFKGSDRSILISADGYVLDGHHQWLAKRASGEPVKAIQLDAPIGRLVSAVRKFPSAELAGELSREQNVSDDKASNEQVSRVPRLASGEEALQRPKGQALEGLRGPRDQGGAGMDGRLPGVSGRSGEEADTAALAGSNRNGRRLRTGELPMGDAAGAGGESAVLSQGRDQRAGDDDSGGRSRARGAGDDIPVPGAKAGAEPRSGRSTGVATREEERPLSDAQRRDTQRGGMGSDDRDSSAQAEESSVSRDSARTSDASGYDAARYGIDHEPLSDGGKPYATRKAAEKTQGLLRHMRIVDVDGGFALVNKSPAQLAAEEKAARRLSTPNTSEAGMPIPAHAFIAAEGGLRRSEMADSGFDKNVRIGNRTLFAAQGKGMSIEQALEKLQQAHYLPAGALHNEAYDLIRRSVTDPQYNPEGWARIAETESKTRFEDYLKAEQDREDPLTVLPEEYLKDTGTDALTPEQADEMRALVAAAAAEGVDTEAALERAAIKAQNGDSHDYFREARSSLEAAPRPGSEGTDRGEGAGQGRPAPEPASTGRGSEVPGEQGARRGEEADPLAAQAAHREAVVAARKRESVLNSLRKCLGAA